MNRRSFVRNLAAAGAGFSCSCLLGAGAQSKSEADDFIIHSNVRLVLLDVSVKDSQGHAVAGLSQDDFRVEEDGRMQQIKVFDHDDLPVTLGILVDESRSMTPKRGAVLVAAGAFIRESNRNDEFFVINFNETVTAGLPAGTPFSDDIQQLREALDRGTPEGRTALNDAVVAGLEQLKLGRRAKKTLVLISDGGDNASRHTRQQMLAMVERNIATIYGIGLFDAEDSDKDPGILKQLAALSGGEAYFPAGVEEMLPVCHRIALDIRSRYTVGYLPSGSANGVRHIRIHASAPGRGKLITRTRTSYLYEDAEGAKHK